MCFDEMTLRDQQHKIQCRRNFVVECQPCAGCEKVTTCVIMMVMVVGLLHESKSLTKTCGFARCKNPCTSVTETGFCGPEPVSVVLPACGTYIHTLFVYTIHILSCGPSIRMHFAVEVVVTTGGLRECEHTPARERWIKWRACTPCHWFDTHRAHIISNPQRATVTLCMRIAYLCKYILANTEGALSVLACCVDFANAICAPRGRSFATAMTMMVVVMMVARRYTTAQGRRTRAYAH